MLISSMARQLQRRWFRAVGPLGTALLLCVGLAALPAHPAYAASIVVNSTADSQTNDNQCTLREAIINANNDDTSGSPDCVAGSGADTITFDLTGTAPYVITLSSELPAIVSSSVITITGVGPTAAALAISGNNATRLMQVNLGGQLTLDTLTMTNGNTTINGGGIRSLGGALIIRNSTFVSNTSGVGGSAIASIGPLTVINSTFANNHATKAGSRGGAISASGSLGTNIRISNSTFTQNTAATGGGFYISDLLSVVISNSTFSANGATNSGGNLVANRAVIMQNTILANSSSGGDCEGTVTDGGGNLVEDHSCGITGGSDPLLGPLGNYGGSTATLPLLPGSPAIDGGTNTGCELADQRGIPRPQQDICDIGAFESRGFTMTTAGGNNQDALINTAFAIPLAITILSSFSEPVGPGGQVTFSAPSSGASINPAVITGTTTVTGAVSIAATANAIAGGPYNVTVSARGVTTPVIFTLINTIGSYKVYLPLIKT